MHLTTSIQNHCNNNNYNKANYDDGHGNKNIFEQGFIKGSLLINPTKMRKARQLT